MSYRPITDVWFLARSKVKYYGAYPAGFLERARALLGVDYNARVLHVCGGKVRDYPYPRFAIGDKDRTLDADPETLPDVVGFAGHTLPTPVEVGLCGGWWDAILADPPYSREDAEHYQPGANAYPLPSEVLKRMLEAVKPGGRVGLLHYELPRPPKDVRFVAAVAVIVGYGNRVRLFSVFERPHQIPRPAVGGVTDTQAAAGNTAAGGGCRE